MPPEVQEACGCVIGRDYPEPVVDHKQAREEAMTRFRAAADLEEGAAASRGRRERPLHSARAVIRMGSWLSVNDSEGTAMNTGAPSEEKQRARAMWDAGDSPRSRS